MQPPPRVSASAPPAAWRGLLLAALLLGGAAPTIQARPICSTGTFLLEAPPFADDAASQLLTIDGGLVSVGYACPPAPVRLRPSKDGTRVRAKLTYCEDLDCPVKLTAVVTDSCQLVTGTLRSRRCQLKLRFAGARSSCGNGVRDEDESCDLTDLGTADCESEGYPGGVLGCATDCTFDVSLCDGGRAPVCGNGVREDGEECDGADVGSATCANQGFPGGGRLRCTSACSLSVDECRICGDGARQGGEECDGADDLLCPVRGRCGTGLVGGIRNAPCSCPQTCCVLPGSIVVCDEALAAAGGVDFCTAGSGVISVFAGLP